MIPEGRSPDATERPDLSGEQSGFSLIELMVVVLIIAILLAIAIPTFLGERDSANARAAQADLRNAVTAEQAQWAKGQSFSASPTVMVALEQGLTWTTAAPSGTNQVGVVVNANGDLAVIQIQGKDGNCYFEEQSNNTTTSFTGYAVMSGNCQTMPTPGAVSSNPVLGGSASANPASNSVALPTNWYSRW